jgi:hypothetical protein
MLASLYFQGVNVMLRIDEHLVACGKPGKKPISKLGNCAQFHSQKL